MVMAAWCSVKTSDQCRVASLVWIWVTLLRNRNSLARIRSVRLRMKETYMAEMGSM